MSVIKIKNLSKSYKKKEILSNISLDIDSNNIIALIGKNGSGKTTLLKCLSKTIEIDQGKITFGDEEEFDKLTDILLIPDKTILPKNMTIEGIVEIFEEKNKNFDRKYVEDFLKFLSLNMDQVLGELSKGNQEIIQIGVFIANKPKFLLMDEPLAAVDVIKRNFLYDKIIDLNADGVGILLSSHILGEIQNLFSKVIILENHQIKEEITVESIYEKGYENMNDYVFDILK